MSDIYVTGIGLMTPLALGRERSWRSLISGETGIRRGAEGLEARVPTFSPNGARSRAGDLAIMAADEALRHAEWDLSSDEETGCAVGQSKPVLDDAGAPNAGLLLGSFTGWSLESVVRDHFRLTGPTANTAAACATGVTALDAAAAWIRSGRCERALAGAAEASLYPFYRAGFQQMGVLADGFNSTCARPFDRNRSGFVMGEGSAILALESEASCRRRGKRPIARLASTALRHNPGDAIRLDDGGRAVCRLIRAALNGRPAPEYLNAHGTGTVMNDAVEARGIRGAFGSGAPGVAVGSTKAGTGHLLGAAGAVEAAFCALAIRDAVAPPTLNLEDPDPLCDFRLMFRRPRSMVIRSALSLSYGFGGQMGAVLFEGV